MVYTLIYIAPSLMDKSHRKWLYLHDGKPGHLSQLQGLSQAIVAQQPSDQNEWLNVADLFWWQRLLAQSPELRGIAKPDVIVAAGHRTHWAALLLGRRWQAHTAVIMRPSLPISMFNSVIMPKHDSKAIATPDNVYLTEGALNKLGERSFQASEQGLILLGGHSKHFEWPSDQISQQVLAIVRSQPQLEWTIADSRRTPKQQLARLQQLCPEANFQAHNTCPTGWLNEQMSRSKCLWITPDSVSMVYEALSSGAQCGLIDLPPKASNRINQSMLRLIAEGKVETIGRDLTRRHASQPLPRLNEARGAAEWLISRLANTA